MVPASEIKKVVANRKFGQMPKIFSNVDTATTPEDFMSDLFKNNFEHRMDMAAFTKAVRLEKKNSRMLMGKLSR